MENKYYKNNGSVIIWVLRNNLQDAFIVWMLAQQYDRYQHKDTGRTTGIISSPFFVSHLATSMATTIKTAKKRLKKAVECGFLNQVGPHKYLITSHNRMVGISMDDQQRHLEDDCGINPIKILDADREYTILFEYWVDPKDIYNTTLKLSAIEEIQSGILGRGRRYQGNIIDKSSRTMIRRTHYTGNNIVSRYVLFDVYSMLVEPKCSPTEAIDIFIQAEKLARSLKHLIVGRNLLRNKYSLDHSKTFLSIQLPNAFYNKHIVKEVPAIRERQKWLRKAGLVNGYRSISSDHVQHQYTTWLNGKFIGSKMVGVTDQFPGDTVARAVTYLEKILGIDECYDLIMAESGSMGIRHPFSAHPFLLKEKDVTPYVETSSNPTYSSLA